MAYASIEPFGFEGADAHAAMLAAVMARAWGSKTATPKDFSLRQEADVDLAQDDEAAATALLLGAPLPPSPRPKGG